MKRFIDDEPSMQQMKDECDLAMLLDVFQASENNGRGVECVRSIVAYLYRGDVKSAGSVRRIEGDKTRMHPLIEEMLLMSLGCRLHLIQDCQGPWCKRQ